MNTRGRLTFKINTRVKFPVTIRKKKCNYCDDVIRFYKRENVLENPKNHKNKNNIVEIYTKYGDENQRTCLEHCIIGNAYRPCGPISLYIRSFLPGIPFSNTVYGCFYIYIDITQQYRLLPG